MHAVHLHFHEHLYDRLHAQDWNTTVLTSCTHVSSGVEILEYEDVILALPAHVVKPLLGVMHEVHRRACVMLPDVVCFDKALALHGLAIANREGPVLDSID